jgi:hypothetical protein
VPGLPEVLESYLVFVLEKASFYFQENLPRLLRSYLEIRLTTGRQDARTRFSSILRGTSGERRGFVKEQVRYDLKLQGCGDLLEPEAQLAALSRVPLRNAAGESADAAEIDALDEQAVGRHLQFSFNAIGISNAKIPTAGNQKGNSRGQRAKVLLITYESCRSRQTWSSFELANR